MSLMSGESPGPNKQSEHLNRLPGTSGSSVLAARVSEDSQSPESLGQTLMKTQLRIRR